MWMDPNIVWWHLLRNELQSFLPLQIIIWMFALHLMLCKLQLHRLEKLFPAINRGRKKCLASEIVGRKQRGGISQLWSSVIQLGIDQGEERQMRKTSSGNSRPQQLEERPEQPQLLHHSEDARQVLATLCPSCLFLCPQLLHTARTAGTRHILLFSLLKWHLAYPQEKEPVGSSKALVLRLAFENERRSLEQLAKRTGTKKP